MHPSEVTSTTFPFLSGRMGLVGALAKSLSRSSPYRYDVSKLIRDPRYQSNNKNRIKDAGQSSYTHIERYGRFFSSIHSYYELHLFSSEDGKRLVYDRSSMLTASVEHTYRYLQDPWGRYRLLTTSFASDRRVVLSLRERARHAPVPHGTLFRLCQ